MKTKIMNRLPKSVWLVIILIGCTVGFPMSLWASEEPKLTGADEPKLTIDYDTSDPVQYKARIMEIDHEKARLVVAEETIFVVDFMMGETRFATEVKDAKGKPKPLASFKQGDIVYVQGFKNADGVVFASLVQKVKSPKVKKGIRQKPRE